MLDVTDPARSPPLPSGSPTRWGRRLEAWSTTPGSPSGPAGDAADRGPPPPARDQPDGQVEVTQAMLPAIRRAARADRLRQLGRRPHGAPFTGAYHASKFGIEAVGDCLRQELRPWSIEVSLIEPGSVATPIWDGAGGSPTRSRARTRRPGGALRLGDREVPRDRPARGRAGHAPEKVAEAIEHALTASPPQTRYLVGARPRSRLRLACPTASSIASSRHDRAPHHSGAFSGYRARGRTDAAHLYWPTD